MEVKKNPAIESISGLSIEQKVNIYNQYREYEDNRIAERFGMMVDALIAQVAKVKSDGLRETMLNNLSEYVESLNSNELNDVKSFDEVFVLRGN